MTLLHDITTDEYGQSYDLVSIEACLGFAIGMVLYVVHCFIKIDFSIMEYAGGFAMMLTATATAARVKPPAIANTPTIPDSQ